MTLTTETIKQWRSDAENIARRSCVYETEYSAAEAILALTSELLANREAQPVLYASEETLAYAKEGEKSLVTWSEPMGDAVIPLYAAPPAPAVPDVAELDAVLAWILKLPVPTEKATHFAKRLSAVIDTCRAAMLAAAPGES